MIFFLQAALSQFKMLQVVPKEHMYVGFEAMEQPDCDFRFPAAAVLPVQGLWFIEWLQRRVRASDPGRSSVYRGLNNVCAQLNSLTDVLKGCGVNLSCKCIPFKMFLKLESKLAISSGDWLDYTERHSFLRNEVIEILACCK
jgi:hypothetical protein